MNSASDVVSGMAGIAAVCGRRTSVAYIYTVSAGMARADAANKPSNSDMTMNRSVRITVKLNCCYYYNAGSRVRV